jgi:hypothetical protein
LQASSGNGGFEEEHRDTSGGVSPMVRVIGTPLPIEDALRFMDELQASSKTQLVRASANDRWLLVVEPPAMDWQNTPVWREEKWALLISTCGWHFQFDAQDPQVRQAIENLEQR